MNVDELRESMKIRSGYLIDAGSYSWRPNSWCTIKEPANTRATDRIIRSELSEDAFLQRLHDLYNLNPLNLFEESYEQAVRELVEKIKRLDNERTALEKNADESLLLEVLNEAYEGKV